ncbi:hypothetical protein TSUD_420590 [Trifolium subterraneum]|uniref:Uncharacterized protein n=1 Tax=Trifolium subterraneum TaxID=3900 RepID=A0A1B5Z8H7_TRISU|nr:hypothetical protein TSUD_420590 [Trifolium subterraneum]
MEQLVNRLDVAMFNAILRESADEMPTYPVVNNFVPDEFSPGPVPNAVYEALNNEDIEDDEGCITSFPCTAGSTFYAPPPASSVVSMLKEVGTPLLRSGSFVLKKLYTSDDELDE